MQYHFITIEGNIGAGKTTLSRLLAKHYNARLILEEFADNPFLPKFYQSPSQYAFPLELFFMAERFKQLKDLLQQKDMFHTLTISDYLFTKCLLFASINLPKDEYKLYQRLFEIIHQQLIKPDLLIYLHAPVSKLQQNIKRRNRIYEQQIQDQYLLDIQDSYLEYIRNFNIPTLILDVSKVDFLTDEAYLQAIITRIDGEVVKGQEYLNFLDE